MPPRGADLWRFILDHRLLDVHTCMPGKVVSFDATAQTIKAQPLIKHAIQGVDGSETVESYPELRDVPILYPRAGGYVIAWPLSVDDPVLLMFAEWPISNYREKGIEDHPIDSRRHGLSGVMALPVGPYKAADTISETIDALMIGYDGGAVVRIADDGTIRIGATGSTVQAVALADDVKTEIDALRTTVADLVTAYNAHVHTLTGCLGGAHASSAGAPSAVNDVGSSKVEAEE